MSTNKRGRLPSGRPYKAKQKNQCVVVQCNEIIRGDRIPKHFRDNSKMDVLDEAKKMDSVGVLTNGLAYIDRMCIDSEKQKNHTKYLLANGYSSSKLPNMKSDEFKKKNDTPLPKQFLNFFIKAPKRQTAEELGDEDNSETETDEDENIEGSGFRISIIFRTMIRGTSEAACETVGSIMNIHSGRNCHLKPEKFSKEIVLRYNLGPMHVLDDHDFIEEIYNREKKE